MTPHPQPHPQPALQSQPNIVITGADVFKAGVFAARLRREPNGVSFSYLTDYLVAGLPAVASTLPLTATPHVTPAGAVPPYLAGLLPEGRRLSALRAAVKTSADDELTLLVTVGSDAIGDVQVVPTGERPPQHPETARIDGSFAEMRFADLLSGEGMTQRPSLSGAQVKASASMISVPVSRKHERYILKLNPPEHPHLVENEAWFLGQAARCGLPVASHRVVRDADDEPGLLVTRFDRVAHEGGTLSLAMEDGCQALNLWPADKYNTSTEAVALALMNLTAAPLVAARELVRQLAFAWVTGNGDVHSKNLAVLSRPDGERRMAPAYDLPSTLFYGDTTLALTVGGRDTLSLARLRACGLELGLPTASTDAVVAKLLARTRTLEDEVLASALPFDRRTLDTVARQIRARRNSLKG